MTLFSPQVQYSRLNNESEQVLQGFQGSKQQFCLAGVISISHVAVQYFGEFPLEREQKRRIKIDPAEFLCKCSFPIPERNHSLINRYGTEVPLQSLFPSEIFGFKECQIFTTSSQILRTLQTCLWIPAPWSAFVLPQNEVFRKLESPFLLKAAWHLLHVLALPRVAHKVPHSKL